MNCQLCHATPCVCGTGWHAIRCATCFQSPCRCSVVGGIGGGSIDWTRVFGPQTQTQTPLSDADVKKIIDGVVAALRPEGAKVEIEALRLQRNAAQAELAALKQKLAELVK